MTQVLTDASKVTLVSAIEENLCEHFALFGRLPGARLCDTPDMMWVTTPASRPVPNGVYRTQLSRGAVGARIEEVLDEFESRRVKTMYWVRGPSTRPDDLARDLKQRGFTHTRDWVGMAIDLTRTGIDLAAPAEVRIEPVQDAEELSTWLRVFRASSNFPEAGEAFVQLFSGIGPGRDRPLRHYIGHLDGAPVGRTTLAFAAGVAGIHWVATAPEARRRGVASALVVAALRDARAAGYRFGVLHSTAMAIGTYRRIGFEALCELNVYERELGGMSRT